MRRLVAALLLGGVFAASSAPAAAVVTENVPRAWIVALRDGAAPSALSHVGHVTGYIPELRLARVIASRRSEVDALPVVRWVEPDRIRYIADKPNDPLWDHQWPMRVMNVLEGWERETGTRYPVLVGVVDTGVALDHPDLQPRLVGGFDFVNRDEFADDDHGHGTHVSGVISAIPDNRVGIAGVSWGAKIMPLKACADSGGCNDFAVVQSIVFALAHGAKVVNLSLGGAGTSCPPYYEAAADLAEQTQTLLVAASGNAAQDGNPLSYPASCDGFVSVGATDVNDAWARFSNHNEFVDLSAPGVAIMSTLPTDKSPRATPGYGVFGGTSMAAPHVAALAALLYSQHPDWTPAQVEQRMKETAVDLGRRGRDDRFGAGRINVARALRAR